MESQRKCREIKLVTTERRRKHLPSEPNTTNLLTKNLLGIEIKKLRYNYEYASLRGLFGIRT